MKGRSLLRRLSAAALALILLLTSLSLDGISAYADVDESNIGLVFNTHIKRDPSVSDWLDSYTGEVEEGSEYCKSIGLTSKTGISIFALGYSSDGDLSNVTRYESEIALSVVYEKDGEFVEAPENYYNLEYKTVKNIYFFSAEKSGTFRLVAEDGTYAEIISYLPVFGYYSSPEASDETSIGTGTKYMSPGKHTVYAINLSEDNLEFRTKLAVGEDYIYTDEIEGGKTTLHDYEIEVISDKITAITYDVNFENQHSTPYIRTSLYARRSEESDYEKYYGEIYYCPELSNKGLVVSYCYDGEKVCEIGKSSEGDYYSYFGKTVDFEADGGRRLLLFGWNEASDYDVPVNTSNPENPYVELYTKYTYKNMLDGLLEVTKQNAEGEFVSSDDLELAWDDYKGYWYIRTFEPGIYRIRKTDEADNAIIQVKANYTPMSTADVFEDEDCTKVIAANEMMEATVPAPKTGTKTVYVRVKNPAAIRTTGMGFYTDGENIWNYEKNTYAAYHEMGSTFDGVTCEWLTEKSLIAVTYPSDYAGKYIHLYTRIYYVEGANYTREDSYIFSLTVNNNSESETKLVVNTNIKRDSSVDDWLESYTGEIEEGSDYYESLSTSIRDEYKIFALGYTYDGDLSRATRYESEVALSVVYEKDGEFVTAPEDYYSLEYKTGKNIYFFKTFKTGNFRLVAENGAYIEVSSHLFTFGYYSSPEAGDETYLGTGTKYMSPGKHTVYAINLSEDNLEFRTKLAVGEDYIYTDEIEGGKTTLHDYEIEVISDKIIAITYDVNFENQYSTPYIRTSLYARRSEESDYEQYSWEISYCPELSKKGLVVSSFYDGEKVREIGKSSEGDYYSYFGKTVEYNADGGRSLLLFGWNEASDYDVPVNTSDPENPYVELYAKYTYKNMLDGLLEVTKQNAEGEFVPSDDLELAWDDYKGYWYIRTFEPGIYRIRKTDEADNAIIQVKARECIDSAMKLSTETVTVEIAGESDIFYNGYEQTPEVTVTGISNGRVLEKDLHYSVVYSNNKAAGTAIVKIIGNDYMGVTGTIIKTFKIQKRDIADLDIVVDEEIAFDPAGAKANVVISLDEFYTLQEGVDYTLSYSNNKELGTAKVTVVPMGSIGGTAAIKNFEIVKASLASLKESGKLVNNSAYTYYAAKTGDVVKPVIELVYNGTKLIENVDFTVRYYDVDSGMDVTSVTAGTMQQPKRYIGYIFGKGNYDSDSEANITHGDIYVKTLSRTSISSFTIDGIEKTYEYAGPAGVTPAVILKDAAGVTVSEEHYNVAYEKNINIGTATIIVTAKGDEYEGVLKKTFIITKKAVTADSICEGFTAEAGKIYYELTPTAAASGKPYINTKGKLVNPKASLTAMWAEAETQVLQSGKDYTITYPSTGLAGIGAVAKVVFKGNYSGTVEVGLGEVDGYSIVDVLSVSGAKNVVYSGAEIKPKYTVKIMAETAAGESFKATMVQGKDYVPKYDYYSFDDSELVETGVIKVLAAGKYVVSFAPTGKYNNEGDDKITVAKTGDFDFLVSKTDISKASVTLRTTSFAYDEAVSPRPAVKVVLNKKTLVEGVDYTVSYEGNDKPGTAYVYVKGINNRIGTIKKSFTINGQVSLRDSNIYADQLSDSAYYMPGGATLDMIVLYRGSELELGKDYTVEYTDNKAVSAPGTYATATIKGKGKYIDTYPVTFKFTVKKGNFNYDEFTKKVVLSKTKAYKSDVNGDVRMLMGVDYKGQELKPDPVVTINGIKLVKGTDYEVKYLERTVLPTAASFGNNTQEITDSVIHTGEYEFIIEGKGNYEGTYRTNCGLIVIPPCNTKLLKITTKNVPYTGEPHYDMVTSVKYNGKLLTEHVDYEIFSEDVVAGWSISDYMTVNEGYNSLKSVIGKDLTGMKITGSMSAVTPGKKKVYIVGIGDYKMMGVKAADYKITGFDISKATVSVASQVYVGYEICPEVTVTITRNGVTETLENGTDYYVEYSKNVNAGTATAVIKGIRSYTGTSKKVTFKIKPVNDMERLDINALDVFYTGADKNANVLIRDNLNGKVLVKGKDYTISKFENAKKPAASDAVKAPKVTIKFKGNYSGTVKRTYTINKGVITNASVAPAAVAYAKLDTKGYISSYKASVVVKESNTGAKLSTSDYSAAYFYAEDTIVYDGATGQYVERSTGAAVKSTDKLKPGVMIKCVITGRGNAEGTAEYTYCVIKK